MNRRRGWLGSIMADRPKDRAVPDDDVVHLLAYIHNNPVRAGVVVRAAESSWTSHRAYLGVVECPGWLHVDEGLRRSGLPDARTFDAWVDANPGKAEYLELAKIRREARRRGAVELATPTGGARPHVPLVARPFARLRTDPRLVINAVANIIGVSASEMCSRIRSRVAIDGRAAAVHCGKALGIRGSDLAAALGVSAAAVSQIGARPVTPDQARIVRIALERLEIEQAIELKTVPEHP
jgi:hypothetical protein